VAKVTFRIVSSNQLLQQTGHADDGYSSYGALPSWAGG
jgi:hypothetical protein